MAQSIEITHLEARCLSDALSLHQQGPPDAVEAGPYPELLLKIGRVFLDATLGGQPIAVTFTWHELWAMREFAKTPIAYGPEPVGYNLARKIYAALLAESADREAYGIRLQLGETGKNEPGRVALHDRFKALKEEDTNGNQGAG